jgi:hypothetical protein
MFNDPSPRPILEFAEARVGAQNKALDLLEELQPGSEVPICQTFRISDRALPYSEAHLKLELLLSEPSSDASQHCQLKTDHPEYPHLRSIAWYGMRLQVAGTYSYSRDASFLLVVNAYTVNTVIHQTISFIEDALKLSLDIFNVSVNGSLISPDTGHHVIEDYEGKSVLLFTNDFPYFGKGTRNIFGLLDPQVMGNLARAGTSFLMLGPSDKQQSAVEWSGMLELFEPGNSHSEASTHSKTLKELHQALCYHGAPSFSPAHPQHSWTPRPWIGSNPVSRLNSTARTTATKFQKTFPLRTFTVHGNAAARSTGNIGRVEVYEGLARDTKLRYSLQDFDPKGAEIPDFNKLAIISALPFASRVQMLWNIMRTGGAVSGVASTELYTVKGATQSGKSAILLTVSESSHISNEICQAITLSIEHDLLLELAAFLSKPSWPDPLPTANSLSHLPLFSSFLTVSQNCAASHARNTIPTSEGTTPLTHIIGTISAALAPLSIAATLGRAVTFGYGSRKAGLQSPLASQTAEILAAASFEGEHLKQMQNSLQAQRSAVVALLKTAGSARKGLLDLAGRRVTAFAKDGKGTAYIDLPVLSGARFVDGVEMDRMRGQVREFQLNVMRDWEAARVVREEMVS